MGSFELMGEKVVGGKATHAVNPERAEGSCCTCTGAREPRRGEEGTWLLREGLCVDHAEEEFESVQRQRDGGGVSSLPLH